jgi:hypothetical protein
LSPQVLADKGPQAFKLEGAWIAKVVGTPAQWSYVISADPSGRRAAGHGSIDVGFNEGLFGCSLTPPDSTSPILINVVMTGPDTAAGYSIWYGLRKVVGPFEAVVVYLGVVRSELKFVAPDQIEAKHYFAYYVPGENGFEPTDYNPFPGDDATPVCGSSEPVYTVDTRVPAP